MRIGINAFPLRAEGGGSRYVFAGLFASLLKLDREHQYVVFCHLEAIRLVYQVLKASGDTLGGTGPNPRVKVIHIQDENQIWHYRYEFDLFFGPLNNLSPRLYDRPSVAILHDIQEQYFPENFSRGELIGRREVYPDICRSATILVAISEFCKNTFVDKFDIDPTKIEVIPNGPQADLVNAPGNGHWSRGPLPERYIFYPANAYKHKNHGLLLDAVAKLRTEGINLPIVFSGYELAGGFPLRKEIAARGMTEQCHFFTDLPPEELRYLFRHAISVVMPTNFEGFGMPAIEAAACGAALVCTDLPVLREILDSNALYFEPNNLDDLCRQIRRVVEDAPLREGLIEHGFEIAKRYTWDASATKMLAVFERARERFVWAYHKPASVKRPRIGVNLRLTRNGADIVKTVESLLCTGYSDLVMQCELPPNTPSNVRSFLKSAGVKMIGASQKPDDSEASSRRAADDFDPQNLEEALKVLSANAAANESAPATNGHANGKHLMTSEEASGPTQTYSDLQKFAREQHLDLVTEAFEGNRFKISALDSAAWAYFREPNTPVHLGEAMEWRGDHFLGVARLRLTGDDLWKIEGFLYPEQMFIVPAALDAWPEGLSMATSGPDWHWMLAREARRAGRLFLTRRTLADCDRLLIAGVDRRQAARSGMFMYYDVNNDKRVHVRLLRRIEPVIKNTARILPLQWQHAGTRMWYRLSR